MVSPPESTARGTSREGLPPLRFADDDAAAFYEFIMERAASGTLLAIMDRETQRLYPHLVDRAKPPTLFHVRAAVSKLRRMLSSDHAAGDRSTVFVFFSGHGVVAGETPTLTLLDGGINQTFLYEEILNRLPAAYVHLFVDACHAAGVVRPRDAEAKSVRVSAPDAAAFLLRSTLARFPHVGALMASAEDTMAHEWDEIRHGVFTHALLSALRGAADVNRDKRIEYSEVYAFISSANRSVTNARARLSVIARPPDIDGRVAILTLTERRDKGAWLNDIPWGARAFLVEDEKGRRLATVNVEPNFLVDLLLPAGLTIYLRSHGGEAHFEPRTGQELLFSTLEFHPSTAQARGSLDEAVKRGLFSTRFGPGYYSGFIDQTGEFVPVPITEQQALDRSASASLSLRETRDAGTKLLIGPGVFAATTPGIGMGYGVRIGLRPGFGAGPLISADARRASEHDVVEWQGIGSAGWLWPAAFEGGSAWIGGAAQAGVVFQTVPGRALRTSGLFAAGPTLGVNIDLSARLGLWAESELLGQVHRRDARTVLSLVPAAWLGGTFAP
ncbi:MAG TPA: caspase family protein [Polyangiaceae bacterium]